MEALDQLNLSECTEIVQENFDGLKSGASLAVNFCLLTVNAAARPMDNVFVHGKPNKFRRY